MIRVRPSPRLVLRTPEHVTLELALADLGSRATAFFLDLLLQGILLLGLFFALGALRMLDRDVTAAVLLVAAFVARNFYFTWSELHWQGRTPGKRALGLRVVARDGGPLTADLLFARNLTRELETFLPLTVLFAPESLVPGGPWWARVATGAWVLVLTLLPFTNRRRARLGDLLAGTVVVFEPRAELDWDLVADGRQSGAVEEYRFTAAQLDIYGIRELQVLEKVLRRPPSEHRDELLEAIAAKVRRKIAWQGAVEPQRFLKAFYAAQRGRLERGLLFGRRRERKVG